MVPGSVKRVKAIRSPPGDQTGDSFESGGEVSCRRFDPSAFTEKICVVTESIVSSPRVIGPPAAYQAANTILPFMTPAGVGESWAGRRDPPPRKAAATSDTLSAVTIKAVVATSI